MRGSPSSGVRKIPRNAMFASGLPESPMTNLWNSMMHRCYNPNSTSYHNYGGRGIYVDEAWHSASQFIADMGERPPGATVERIDNDGPYSKANCRWASRKAQAMNTRRTILLSHDGETMSEKDWAKRIGIARATLQFHIKKGRSIADVIELRKVR